MDAIEYQNIKWLRYLSVQSAAMMETLNSGRRIIRFVAVAGLNLELAIASSVGSNYANAGWTVVILGLIPKNLSQWIGILCTK